MRGLLTRGLLHPGGAVEDPDPAVGVEEVDGAVPEKTRDSV